MWDVNILPAALLLKECVLGRRRLQICIRLLCIQIEAATTRRDKVEVKDETDCGGDCNGGSCAAIAVQAIASHDARLSS